MRPMALIKRSIGVSGARLIGEWADDWADGFMEAIRVRFELGGRGVFTLERPGSRQREAFRWSLEGSRLTINPGKEDVLAAVRFVGRHLHLDPAPWTGTARLKRVVRRRPR